MKKGFLCFLLIIFAISVIGCSATKSETGDNAVSDLKNSDKDSSTDLPESIEFSENDETEKNNVLDGWEEIPKKIADSNNDTITFDSLVTVPERFQNGYGEIWNSEKLIFDERVLDAFEIDEASIVEKDEIELNDSFLGKYTDFWMKTENGAELTYGGYYLQYHIPEYFYYTNCINSDERLDDYNMDQYGINTDLDFMPYQEAAEKMKELMDNIGFSVSDQYICYALDYETLGQQEDCTDVMGEWVEEDAKGEWTKEDDCYLFEFHQEVEGVPVSKAGYGNMADAGNSNSSIEIFYGVKGIIGLYITHVYDIQEKLGQTELLTAADIKELLIANQELIIGGNEIKITDMQLVLLPISREAGKYELTPVWEISEEVYYPELDATDYRTVHFDAGTGQEIA